MPPVVLTFAPDADSSDFEEVTYPGNISDLPLYHMDSEARHRRVGREPGYENGPSDVYEKPPFAPDDGEGKDVYSKLRPTRGNFLGGGRVRQPPPPPPTSIVRNNEPPSLHPEMNPHPGRIHPTKLGTHPPHHLHAAFVLYTLPQDRLGRCRRLGRSPFWKIRLALPQARILL